MKYEAMSSMILNQLQALNDYQKSSLIDYLQNIPREEYPSQIVQKKGLKRNQGGALERLI